jgi:uncharacterized membrane protein
MAEGLRQFERFLVAMPCIVVISLCILVLVRKMVSGDLPAGPGVVVVGFLVAVMWFCVNPPHPVFPGVALVAVVSLMVSFPFVERQLELQEHRQYDLARLERAFAALQQKPDNPSAAFEAAKWLWQQGFRRDAMAIAEATLARLDTRRDEIKNTSMREMFRAEEHALRMWRSQPPVPEPPSANMCPACRTVNEPGNLFCSGCKRPYLLDKARLAGFKDKVFVKLVIAYAAICGVIVAGGAIGLVTTGVARWIAVGSVVAVVGLVLGWMLKPPSAAKQ